ncbi:hypothetical protein ED146_24015 [Escherichia coli]|nr:hypothetical protein [Escherichia coli]EEV6124256.1 hypothetical protein [Escherichia coli]EEY5935157.1 hypothetical protein [Escherichia coli]EFO0860050.1 hypothetical protein [Escherichia coli]
MSCTKLNLLILSMTFGFVLLPTVACAANSPVPEGATVYCPIATMTTFEYVNQGRHRSEITGGTVNANDCSMFMAGSSPEQLRFFQRKPDDNLSTLGAPTSSYVSASGALLPFVQFDSTIASSNYLGFDWYLTGTKDRVQGVSVRGVSDGSPVVGKDERDVSGRGYARRRFSASYYSTVGKYIVYSKSEQAPEIKRTIRFSYTIYYNNSSHHETFEGTLTVTYKRIDAVPYLSAREPVVECRGGLSCETKGTLDVQALYLYGNSSINARLSAVKDPDVEIYAESGATTKGGKVDDAGLEVTLTSQRTEIPIRYRVTGRSAGTFTKTVNYTLAID